MGRTEIMENDICLKCQAVESSLLLCAYESTLIGIQPDGADREWDIQSIVY